MSTLIQRAFSGGELSPSLYSRVDIGKYQKGVRTLRNFMVMRHGGTANRPGSNFIGEVKTSTTDVRMIEFIYNDTQTYALEFGDHYMRVHRNGVQQKETATVITGVTAANPGVVTTSASHGYSDGDEVYISGVVGMTELNGRNFKVNNVTATTFELQTMDSVDLDTSAYTAYSSAGTAEKVYEIATPYGPAHLFELQYVQSADVVTIVHPDYAPRELARTGHTSWTLSRITFEPGQAAPTSAILTATTGTINYIYHITAVNSETYEESLAETVESFPNKTAPSVNSHALSWTAAAGAGEYNIYVETGNQIGLVVAGVVATGYTIDFDDFDTTLTPPVGRDPFEDGFYRVITGVTQANPAVVTFTGTALFNDGDEVFINDIVGMTELNNRKFTVANKSGLTFELEGEDSTGHTAYSSGGEVNLTDYYPSAVNYYQQRLLFANTNSEPEKVWASRVGWFKNFTTSSVLADSESITFTMSGNRVNEVNGLLTLGTLIMFTSAGEWSINGNESGTLTPSGVNPQQHSYNGSGTVAPVVIENTSVFVQNRGTILRSLGFEFESDGYRGSDLTIFSSHLFDGYTIKQIAYQQVPHSILWVVRSDGVLLGLTFIKEHEMLAWHRHDFEGGLVKSVCSVPEGNQDVLYCVVERTIDDRTTKYVERLGVREFTDIEDHKFLDSHLTYDGTNTSATTMTLAIDTKSPSAITQANPAVVTLTAHGYVDGDVVSFNNMVGMTELDGNSYTVTRVDANTFNLNGIDSTAYGAFTSGDCFIDSWLYTANLKLTSSAAYFASTDVGNEIWLHAGGDTVRCEITAFTSTTIVTVRPHKTVPAAFKTTAMTTWTKAVDEVSGLWHLEGEDVSVFADGFVVSSPYNASYDTITVANGIATLDKPYGVIHVGLPFVSDIETLDIDSVESETLIDKKIIMSEVSIHCEKTRGLWAGPKPPTDDTVDPLECLTEYKIRDDEGYDDPVNLKTGKMSVNIKPEWNSNGRVFVRQVDPLPASVLSIAPGGLQPFKGG